MYHPTYKFTSWKHLTMDVLFISLVTHQMNVKYSASSFLLPFFKGNAVDCALGFAQGAPL